MSKLAIVAAGGTGGHMFPALALGRALVSRGRAVTLITDQRGARYVGGVDFGFEADRLFGRAEQPVDLGFGARLAAHGARVEPAGHRFETGLEAGQFGLVRGGIQVAAVAPRLQHPALVLVPPVGIEVVRHAASF